LQGHNIMKLIIFGISDIARCACEYFTHDSQYEVVGFCVDDAYRDGQNKFMELPLLCFEDVEAAFPADEHDMFIAIGAQQLNRVRKQKCDEAKLKGYKLASYVSSRAFVWHNVKIGENAFILEDNTIQPFVNIGDNVTLWSGNHIGHSTVIESHCFVTSQSVISGHCVIGRYSFLGVNTAVADTVKIGKDNYICIGASVSKNTDDDVVIKPASFEIGKLSATRFCRVKAVA